MKMSDIQQQGNEQNQKAGIVKKAWDKKAVRISVGALVGAFTGWLYWEFIGCNGGSCPLTSNAPQTVIIFSLFGMWFNFRK